jgi:NADPH:quinone reductase-like Zn-dependent oxidoreductase
MAVGVPRVVRLRATGQHPSAKDAQLPYDPSVDGIGLDEATGELYYINVMAAPLFADRANVERSHLLRLAPDSDAVTIAAMTNPTISSWMALKCRAIGGCHGRTVAIVGATSASGQVAAFVARELGATRVIGLGRDVTTLEKVSGLDSRIQLQHPLILPSELGVVHIVLDYVGGPGSVELMQALETPPDENLQYIAVGALAGCMEIQLPFHLLNRKPIIIMASGVGSLSKQDFQREMPGLLDVISRMGPILDISPVPMIDIQTAWDDEEAQLKRLVLIP